MAYMNNRFLLALLVLLLFAAGCGGDEDTKKDDPKGVRPVVKTNPMQVYMHYMPWYQAKPYGSTWGSHWKMANRNPDIVDEDGKRQIASHYYPLIGPYDSRDPDVVEYHLLLMKYAGVDAVLVDWYGTFNVHDYAVNLAGSNALINRVEDVGIKFAIVYEEYTAGIVAEQQSSVTAVEAAQRDMQYVQNNYFSKDSYLAINNTPCLLTFGPRHFKSPAQWTQIFSGLNVKPKFLPLWDHSGFVGAANRSGEFAWVDFSTTLTQLNTFYNKTSQFEILLGAAYPRFHDYYNEGGWGSSYGYVADNQGQTLVQTLAKASEKNLQHLQLVTWNDYGEGTVLEPTREEEFRDLLALQAFTGVSYGLPELQLIHQYYLKKKEYKGNAQAEAVLKEAFRCLVTIDVAGAASQLDQL